MRLASVIGPALFSMPELPEVEVTRRGILPYVTGQRRAGVQVRTPALRWPVPAELDTVLAQQLIRSVSRRGKYLLFEFGAGWLIVHLGMSGTLRVIAAPGHAPPPTRHDHVDLIFDDFLLRLRDPRRFGAVLWHPRGIGAVEAHPLLASLGVEPFDEKFSGGLLYARTRGRSVSVKQAILSGTIVVGVGNIYASESLFRARIRPTLAAGRIAQPRYERLAEAIRATLSAAIDKGGSTLRCAILSAATARAAISNSTIWFMIGPVCRAAYVARRLNRSYRASVRRFIARCVSDSAKGRC